MPPYYFAKVVKEAMRLGAVNFSFQGGEPLLYSDLKDYIKAAQPYKNLISVTTNGTLLTLEKARELKSWGVDIVTISYDDMRDSAIFWEAFHNARKAGLKITVGIVATKTMIGRLDHIVEVAEKYRVIQMLIFPVPMGRWDSQDVMLSAEDIAKIRTYEKKYPYIRTDFQANYVHEGCGAGKEILFINPYGDVYPCPFINIPFGNLRYQSVKKIRDKMLCHKIFQGYSQKCLAGEGKGLWDEFSSVARPASSAK
jgi:MoaA/NifB/PqqE/SkfB family radical SAM enzyme